MMDSVVRREGSLPPVQELRTLADWGEELLSGLIAIDSQSDERSKTVPSTAGQEELAAHLRRFFERLNLRTVLDQAGNLVAQLPSNPEGTDAAPLALICHLDTARGTVAVPELLVTPGWDGSDVLFTTSDTVVNADLYPETEIFLRQDLLHGPGSAPIGLDDKLGIAEVMVLARVLLTNPEIRHGPLVFAFRPDEEIGRLAPVESLAQELAARGVRHAYTVDGVEPFELNTECFHGRRGMVTFVGRPLPIEAPMAQLVRVHIRGVRTHGATAKAEGYRNATVIAARALERLGDRPDVVPLDLASAVDREVDAVFQVLLTSQDEAGLAAAEGQLIAALESEVVAHRNRGAAVKILGRTLSSDRSFTDEGQRLFLFLRRFLHAPGPLPRLAEESEGRAGYSNPYRVERQDGALVLRFRLRAFGEPELAERESQLRRLAEEPDIAATVAVEHEYQNISSAAQNRPELARWPELAAAAMEEELRVRPARGGLVVDPLLRAGIAVANLGTGYFSPESEKEFTSRQMLARHVVWLTHLVQLATTGGTS